MLTLSPKLAIFLPQPTNHMKAAIENIKSVIIISLVTLGFMSPLVNLGFLVVSPQNMTTFVFGGFALFSSCCSAWVISVFVKKNA
jgi:hypothetical protein